MSKSRSAMRLLDTTTGEFVWVNDPRQRTYAILSHVWTQGPDGEQTYHDMLILQAEVKSARIANSALPADEVLRRASPKIRNACVYALSDGLLLIWIDTCCIDKTSSAELSEAINSMYEWYGRATVCYPFLHDVDANEDPQKPESSFRRSRWHTRGWTLQELIAPAVVVFLSSTWCMVGGKHGLSKLLSEVTGVDADILTHSRPLSAVSIAQRMCWASRRVTTRKEDEAYCLMGLFGIHIPVIYGEGSKAFLRLQEEILRQIPDQSIFLWFRRASSGSRQLGTPELYDVGQHVLFASSPAQFHASTHVKAIPKATFARRLGISELPPTTYIMTSEGMRVTLPLIPIAPSIDIAVLACEGEDGQLLGLVLRQTKLAYVRCVGAPIENTSFLNRSADIITEHPSEYIHSFHLNHPRDTAPPGRLDTVQSVPMLTEVYIAHRPPLPYATVPPVLKHPHEPNPSFRMLLSRNCWFELYRHLGYRANLVVLSPHPSPGVPSHLFTLFKEGADWRMAVEFMTTTCALAGADSWSSLSATVKLHGRMTIQNWIGENDSPECADHLHAWRPDVGDDQRSKEFEIGLDSDNNFIDLKVRIALRRESPGSHIYPAIYSLSLSCSSTTRTRPTLLLKRRLRMLCATYSGFEPDFSPPRSLSLNDRANGTRQLMNQAPNLSMGCGSNLECSLRHAVMKIFPESLRPDEIVSSTSQANSGMMMAIRISVCL